MTLSEMKHVEDRQKSGIPKLTKMKRKLNASLLRWASTEKGLNYRTHYHSTSPDWAKRALYNWPTLPDADHEELRCCSTIRQRRADCSKRKKLDAAWRNVAKTKCKPKNGEAETEENVVAAKDTHTEFTLKQLISYLVPDR